MKFTIDTRTRDFIESLTDQTSAVIPALTLGDKFPVSFEFGKDGALDESIGALDTVEVALSSCVTPDRGTFRLFAPGGPITGEPLTLPATTSWKALASAIAASWDGVSLSDLCVTGANGFFRVEFQGSLADTEIDPMTGDGTKLSPRSVVSVSQKEPGGGGNNAVQIISLDSVPLAYADDLTFDDGVFSGILNVDTVAANEAMREAGKGRVSRLLSVRVTDDEGNRTTYAKRPVIVDCTGIPMGPFGGIALPQYLTLAVGDNRYDRIFIDVRRFGAVLDGVTDDADAIESAINFAHSIGGGIVAIAGPFRTSRMMQFDEIKNVTVIGLGRFKTIAIPDQWESESADFDHRSVFYFVDCENIGVEDMSQDGSVADDAGSWLVGTRRCKGVRLTNIGAKDARAVWKDRDSERVFVDDVFLGATEIEYSSDRVMCSMIGTQRFEIRNINGDVVDEAVDLSQCFDGLVENVHATAIDGTTDEVVDIGGCKRVDVRNITGLGGFLSVVRLKEEGDIITEDISIENISGENWTDALLLITASGTETTMETRIRDIRVNGLHGDSDVENATFVRTSDVEGATDDMEILNVSGTVLGRAIDIRRFRRLKLDKIKTTSSAATGIRLRVGEGCDLREIDATASGDAYELISVSGVTTTDQTKGRSTGSGTQNVWKSLNCQGLRLHGFQALGGPHDAIRVRYTALESTQVGLTHDFSIKSARIIDWSNANTNRRAISVEVSGVPGGSPSHGGRIVGNDVILDQVSYASQLVVAITANGGTGYASMSIKDNTVLGAPEIASSNTLSRLIDESIVAGNIVIPTPAP